ncbi:MAG: hypothetical protein ACJA2Q_002100 [Pseudohongiellaceae bacterium]
MTGIFFLVRPAYQDAYAPLLIRSYPQEQMIQLPISDNWLEYRYLKSILGPHLLVRTSNGWLHLNPVSREDYIVPTRIELTALVNDAMDANRARYGQISGGSDFTFLTDTGAEITVDWTKLSLSQRGRDTYWINQVYDIHYLRWTGISWADKILGVAGLLLLILMTVTGIRLLLKSPVR